MKYVSFALVGILFGVVMTKSEAISWWRIQEMFRFDSFHMYGIIGSALAVGVLVTQLMKRGVIKDYRGQQIQINDKASQPYRYLIGGILFGLGWALVGACPGPMFVLLGHGYWSLLVVIASAVLGTFVYGLLRDRLPH